MRFIKTIFIFLLLFSSTKVLAVFTTNGGSTTYSSGTAWTGGVAPDLTFWDGSNDAEVSHTLNHTGTITITSGNVLTIKSGGNFTITGGLSLGNNGTLVIESGGTLTVTGTLDMGNSSSGTINSGGTLNANAVDWSSGSNSLTNSGTLAVTTTFTIDAAGSFTSSGTFTTGGNFTASNGGDVDLTGTNTITGTLTATGSGTDFDLNSGTLSVTSDVTFNGDGNITVAGDMDVGGNMSVTGSGGASVSLSGTIDVTSGTLTVDNNGFINGNGVIGWGTLSANPSCSGAIITCSGTATSVDNNSGGGCGGSYGDPAGTPLDLNTCGIGSLPIELLSFVVIPKGDVNEVYWVTGMELNNNYFEILASEDGIHWEVVRIVQGAGNSNVVLKYHETVPSGMIYYKLRQVDYDGTFADSEIVVVKSENTKAPIVSNNQDYILIRDASGSNLEVYDVRGGLVQSMTVTQDFFIINNSSFSSGVYLLRVGTYSYKVSLP